MMNKFFEGRKISYYGVLNGFVDYATLASTFFHRLCKRNNIIGMSDDWELFSGNESFYTDGCNEYTKEESIKQIKEIDNKISMLYRKKEKVEKELARAYRINKVSRFEMEAERIEDEISECEITIEKLKQEVAKEFTYYWVDEKGATVLSTHTNEAIYYNKKNGKFIWATTFPKDDWARVLTNIEVA